MNKSRDIIYLLFAFLLPIVALLFAMLQGFYPDAITLVNTSLKLRDGQKILNDFFVPEGFMIPMINFYLGYFISEKLFAHFIITILINITYQILIFKILRKYELTFYQSVFFSFISSLFFLTNIGGIYFDHFIIYIFLICIFLYEYFKFNYLNIISLSILLAIILFSKISLGIISIIGFYLYLIFVRKELNKKLLNLTLFFALNILIICIFIFFKDFQNFYLTVIDTGFIYSKYLRSINFLQYLYLPFDLNLEYLFKNLLTLINFSLKVDFAAILVSGISLITYFLYIYIYSLRNTKRFNLLVFYLFFQIFYTGVSGQGIWMKYYFFGILSALVFTEFKSKLLSISIVIFINFVYAYYHISIRYLNTNEFNSYKNFTLYDDGLYRLTLFKNNNVDEISKLIDENNYMILNKDLLYFNLYHNRSSLDPLSVYDPLICNDYSTICQKLIKKNLRKFMPKFLILLTKDEFWNVDDLYYYEYQKLVDGIASINNKYFFNNITVLEVTYN